MSHRPLWVRVAAALATYAGRRRVVRVWCWWDCSELARRVRNAGFRVQHPILMREVDRRVRLLRKGIATLDV